MKAGKELKSWEKSGILKGYLALRLLELGREAAQDSGGARAARVKLKGQKAERPSWLSCPLHQDSGPSGHIKHAPSPASPPGLFLMDQWSLFLLHLQAF